MIGRSIWEIDRGDRYGRSDINEISIGISIWNMCYRFGLQYIDIVIYHIDMVISHIDMGDEANDMGDDRIDMVISHIDMGYLVTLPRRAAIAAVAVRRPPPAKVLQHYTCRP